MDIKQTNVCPICGGKLEKNQEQFVCIYCKNTFEEKKVLDIEEKINSLLDEFKKELVANARTQLWDALHEKYISSDKILDITRIIKTYLPDDFMANFFEFVNTKTNTTSQINDYINDIDYKENYIYIDIILDFMIDSLEPSYLLALNNLIENTYKNNDLKLYNEYATKLSNMAEKIDNGVYDLDIERDVFIAYSSKDIKYVEDITKELDKNGITYFVALKNLRHGKGAVENYDSALEKAIENSKTFLFISSLNSRTKECDALKKEIPYLKKLDKLNAPAEYRNDYNKIPLKYKKPRVQLLIGEKPEGTLADKQIAEIFDGYEWRYDAQSAVEAIYNFLNNDIEIEIESKEANNDIKEKEIDNFVIDKNSIQKIINGSIKIESFKEFIIKEDIDNIPEHLLQKAKNAQIIIIPKSIKTIDKESLPNNDLYIYYDGSISDWLKINIKGKMSDGSFNLCINDSNGIYNYNNKNYSLIKELKINKDDKCDKIGNHQFEKFNFENIDISGVKEIGEYAFSNNTKLINVNISDVINISNYAFLNCYRMNKIILPKSLNIIFKSTFKDCLSLKNINILRKKPLFGMPKGYEKGWNLDKKIIWGSK